MSRRRGRQRPVFASRGPFAVECPSCREPVGAGRDLVGRVAGCPRCRSAFVVPDPDGAEAPPRPAVGGRWHETAPRDESADHSAPPARRRAPEPPAAPFPPAPAPTPAAEFAQAMAREPEVATDRPRPEEEPLVFSEPPPPSTRSGPRDAFASAPIAAAVTGDGLVADAGTGIPPAADPAAGPARASHPDDPGPATGGDGLAFREPVKTVRSGGTEIELRRLTPEEKRTRRARRNLLFLLVGAALLVVLVVVLGTRGR